MVDPFTNIQPGHFLLSENGDTAKILKVDGELLHRSKWHEYDRFGAILTIHEAKSMGYAVKKNTKVYI